MKKQELIHLHGLLAEVSNYVEECDGPVDLTAYESQTVRPTSIHKSKTSHKEAVFALMDGLTGTIGEEEEATAAVAAASAD
jgi:hypothetical protein